LDETTRIAYGDNPTPAEDPHFLLDYWPRLWTAATGITTLDKMVKYKRALSVHSMNFTLRPGEVFTRYFSYQWYPFYQFWGTGGSTAIPPWKTWGYMYTKAPDNPPTKTSAGLGDGLWANGEYIYTPDLSHSSCFEGISTSTDVVSQGSSPKLRGTSSSSEVVFNMRTPYVICAFPSDYSTALLPGHPNLAGATRGAIISGNAAGTVTMQVSKDFGASWQDYGTLSGSFSEDITDLVKGRYQYLVRFKFTSGSGLDSLTLNTRVMVSGSMMYSMAGLEQGTNNIEYQSSNLSVMEFTPDIWSSQAIFDAKKYSSTNLTWYFKETWHVTTTDWASYPSASPGVLIYKLDCPAAIKKLDTGVIFTGNTRCVLSVSETGPSGPWIKMAERTNTELGSWDYPVQSTYTFTTVTNQCYVKMEAYALGKYTNCGFRNPRMYAYYEDPTTSDVIITHGWEESGVPKTHTETIHPGTTFYAYTINVGAPLALGRNTWTVADNKYLRLEVPIPSGMTTISGYVYNNSSAGVNGAIVNLTGSNTGSYTTGSSGFYTFSVSTGGNYTVTPSKTDWVINPVKKTYTNLISGQSSQNFFGAYTGSGYNISGTVISSTGSAMSGVTVALSGSGTGSVTTDAAGAYQFSSLNPGNYVVAPSKTGVTFSPASNSYTSLGDNQTAQNFTGTYIIPAGYSEFICSIKATGGDYNSLASWEAAIDSDLTSASSKVFSGTKTGTIADGASVTGASSGASGTVYHCTQTQLYLNVTAGAFQSGEQIRVDAGNYFTSGNAGNMVIAVAECYPMEDPTPVTIYGWTTSTTNYIEIRTPAAYKHSGKWDTNAYIMDVGAANADSIYINEANVRINGLQIYLSKDDADTSNGIEIYGDGTNPDDIRISNCIIKGKGNYATNNKRGIFAPNVGAAGSKIRIWNNIIYDFKGAGANYYGAYVRNANRTYYIYNNTLVNCAYGFYRDSGVDILMNNITQDCPDGFSGGGWDASSDYNLSDIASDAPGSNSRNSATVTFVNKTNKDFHIAEDDANALDFGINLSTDTYLSFGADIDGDARSGNWDIGADEFNGSSGQVDTTPPEPPANLAVSNQTETSLALSWTESVQADDGDYASYYRIYRNSVLISTASGTSYTNTGLTAGTTYSYEVYSVDNEENQSASAASGSFSTSGAGGDTTPPNEPTSLNSPEQTETSLTISWTASAQANDGDYASYYKVYRNAVLAGSPSGTTFTDTDLTKNTTYSYTVYAVDDAGNQSTDAASGSFSTSGADTTAPTIVSVTVATATTITVEFSEPVEQASAQTKANYSINNGISIVSAVLGVDLKTVTIVTSQHTVGTTYTITVNNIKDLASVPNTMTANSTMNYMYGDKVAPGNVTSLSVMDNPTDKGGKVIVSWTKVSDNDMAGYKVYYSPVPFSSITGATYFSGSPVSNPNTSSCVVTGLIVNSQDYYFGVLAVDLSGNVSSAISSVGPVRAINNRLGETINGQKVYEITMNSYNLKAKVVATPGLNDGVYINIKKPETKVPKIIQANTNAQSNTKIISTTINDLTDTSTEFNALLSLVDKVTIVLSYPSTVTGETEDGLRIYCLNETSNEWELVPGAQELSPLANTVAVEVSHFSVYRILGTKQSADVLTNVIVYPNPFKPNDGKPETGDWNTGINFEGLTNNSTIKIYTLTGEPVISLEETNNDGKYTWDVKNKEKEKVSSGMYIYRITDSLGGKLTGKIGIVR